MISDNGLFVTFLSPFIGYYINVMIHIFGSGSAANLNHELYDWNSGAPSIMIYFKTAEAAKPGAAGSNFTAGSLAVAGVAGLGIGAVVTALATKAVSKKKKAA